MKNLICIFALVVTSSPQFAAEPPHPESPKRAPNILFIAIDDLRCELGCYGSAIAKSPNIDALAATGVRFNRAYCQQAICGPSRASVMTGLRPDATQIHGNHTHFRKIHPDIVTLPQHFKNNGYHTRSMGKIYHGVFPEGSSRTVPDTFGDAESWSIPTFRPGPRYYYTEPGIAAAKGVYEKIYKPKNPSPDDWTKKLVFGPATEAPDVADNVLYDGQVADRAVDSLKELAKTDGPFFLAVGFIKPHSPYIAPKKYFDLYDADSIPLADPNTQKTEGIPSISMHGSGELRRYTDQQKKGPIPEADQRRVRHAYLACISYIDAQVGRVLAELDAQGLAENTIVALWSDHGYHLGEKNLWGKTTNFELDTRVPMIIRAPGFEPGVCESPVELVDLYPTLSELGGKGIGPHLQGESLVKTLKHPATGGKSAAFSQYSRNKKRGYSVRTKTHRYTEWVDLVSGSVTERTLFDHRTDPIESKNLVESSSPEFLAEMSRLLDSGNGWRNSGQPRITLGKPFSSNMVIQRDAPIPVWGSASSGETITVEFASNIQETAVDENGKWAVEFPALKANSTPQILTVKTERSTVRYENILIGDVWICSGQSNMRWMLKQTTDAKNSVANSENPNLRIMNLAATIHPGGAKFPLLKLRNTFADNLYETIGWEVAGPESVPNFSGVAYHFGKKLQAETGVPIGLINNSVGGSPMEAWIPNNSQNPSWVENADLPKWVKGRAQLNLTHWTEAGSSAPAPHHPFEPGFLFTSGVRPFNRLPVRGVIWYQGESNATEDGAGSPPVDPKKNFTTHKRLIESWRSEFQNQDLPFYFVQLPGLNRNWPAFREVQQKIDTLIPNTHMAITLDVGHPTNVHPTTKKPVGERLANLALKHEYNKDIIAEAPRMTGWKVSDDSISLTFDRPVKITSDAKLKISGEDRKFDFLSLDSNKSAGLVLRTGPIDSKIAAIRYAWENDPKASIVCAETGIPVAPFRTDNWPLVAPAKPPAPAPEEEKIDGVGTGFENVKAGEISGEIKSDGFTISAKPGNAKISATHPWKGKHGLHLLGGENRELTIRFPEAVKTGKVLAFQAERWTTRSPFAFKISARASDTDKWIEVFDGEGKVIVGRSFLSAIAIPVKADFIELKLTATTPKSSGVLIDHLRILDKMPPGLVAKEAEVRLKLRARGQDGVNSTRIPGLATTNAGTLIAVYDNRNRAGGDLPGDIDVGMNRSTDGGETWEPMKVIMDMGDDPEWKYDGIGDPAVLVDRKTDSIWVAATWSHGNRSWRGSGPGMTPEETGQFMLVKSDDDGKSWSEPINITKQIKDPKWRFVLQGPGKGITMRDGTLVFPAQFRGENEEPVSGKPFSTLIYSKDRGKSWKIGTGVKIDTTEAQLVELGDGSIMINCRDNRGGSRSIYTTKDLGKTWQEHTTTRSALPEPVCMASLIRVETKKHGPLLFFSNPPQRSGRKRMTIKVSNDEGMTWPEKWHTLVEIGPSAYSCLTAIGDDKVGLLYETPGELVFVRYSIEALLNRE